MKCRGRSMGMVMKNIPAHVLAGGKEERFICPSAAMLRVYLSF